MYALPIDIPVEDLYRRKAAYDRYATILDDVDSYLPLTYLHRFVAEGTRPRNGPYVVRMTFVSGPKRMNELSDGVIRQFNAPTGREMRAYQKSLLQARPALVERDVHVITDRKQVVYR